MIRWIKELFTKELEERIKKLENALKSCERERELLSKLVKDCEAEIEELKDERSRLETEIKHLKNVVIAELRHEIRRLELIKEDLEEDVEYFRKRCDKLLRALREAIDIPDIKPVAVDPVVVRPYDMRLDRRGFDVLFADAEYYAFRANVWESILKPIWREKSKAINMWKRQVADCDDHALVVASFVAMAFEESGFDRQGAFLIVWSPTHAYNAFITDDKKVWIYEPQSGKIKGELMQLKRREPYNSRWLWIPAKKESY